jgi:hypothetical protein
LKCSLSNLQRVYENPTINTKYAIISQMSCIAGAFLVAVLS